MMSALCKDAFLTKRGVVGANEGQRTNGPSSSHAAADTGGRKSPLSRLAEKILPRKNSTQRSPAEFSVWDLSVILSPGVSTRVSAGDATALISAVLVTYGVENKPVKVNPPPMLMQQIQSVPATPAASTEKKAWLV